MCSFFSLLTPSILAKVGMLVTALLCVLAILPDSLEGSCDCAAVEARVTALETTVNWQTEVSGWYLVVHGSQTFAYKLFNGVGGHDSADLKCQQIGARLASVGMRIPEVRNKVKSDVIRPSGKKVWLGLEKKQGQWVWADGVASTRSNTDWADGAPFFDWRSCAGFSNVHQMRITDYSCSTPLRYLCEKVKG